MTDIIRPDFGSKPTGYDDRDATCTGEVPSENPDAAHLRNLRPAESIPLDLLPAALFKAARDDAALRQVIAEVEESLTRLDAALEAVEALLDGGGGDAA